MRVFLSVACMVFSAAAIADVDFTDVVGIIGATYDGPEAIPPSNLALILPGCAYDDSIRFTIDITKSGNDGRQTFLYWLHPKTRAYSVVHQWLVNFNSMSRESYPAVDWATVDETLHHLDSLVSNDPLPYWKVFTAQSDVAPDLMAEFQRLDTAGLQLPYLRLTEAGRNQMHGFFQASNFLSLFSQGGLGNLTLEDFFHTPADPETVSDDQINQMITAINAGFFRRDFVIECQGSFLTASARAKPLAMKDGHFQLATSNMCCDRSTRICVAHDGTSCTMCASFCCLGGVNYCP